jgi:hypothetical protein
MNPECRIHSQISRNFAYGISLWISKVLDERRLHGRNCLGLRKIPIVLFKKGFLDVVFGMKFGDGTICIDRVEFHSPTCTEFLSSSFDLGGLSLFLRDRWVSSLTSVSTSAPWRAARASDLIHPGHFVSNLIRKQVYMTCKWRYHLGQLLQFLKLNLSLQLVWTTGALLGRWIGSNRKEVHRPWSLKANLCHLQMEILLGAISIIPQATLKFAASLES